MNKILFVCGMYAPNPSANGVCVIRLQEVLLKQGINSDTICIGEKPDTIGKSKYGNCYYIQRPTKNSKNKIVAFFQKIGHLFNWPLIGESIKRYKTAIKFMTNNYDYSFVVAVCQPVTAAYACAKFCKKDFIMYELDSITNIPDTLHGIKKLLTSRVNRIEKKIYKKAKYIFHTKCDEKFYEKKKYDSFRFKWEFTDIPHIVNHGHISTNFIKRNERCLAYTGLLTKERNDPEYFLQLVVALSKRRKVKVYFTTHGDCEQLLEKYSILNPSIIFPLGFVSFEKLQEIRQESCAFISLGLKYGGEVTSVQSKIFEYMSTGKQIIHVIGSKNDVEQNYLKEYGNSLLLNRNDNFETNVDKLDTFLNEIKIIDVESVCKAFPMNTPEWTVDRMIDVWKKQWKK